MEVEVGEPIQLPGWPADNFAKSMEEDRDGDADMQLPYFGEEWSKKYLHTCLQKAMPQLNHSSRHIFFSQSPYFISVASSPGTVQHPSLLVCSFNREGMSCEIVSYDFCSHLIDTSGF